MWFSLSRTPRLAHFRLWLELDRQRWLLRDVHLPPEPEQESSVKVLVGRQGWLFLDNDTNGSVDQFTGRMKLTAEGMAGWQDYLTRCNTLSKQHDIPWALLVAPSKESVLGRRYHPMQEGAEGAMDQIQALANGRNVVHPIAALKHLGDKAFIRTDTHWTHRGP
ncbi:alginate O-acetyltransferase AlgX-related protein [Halomonas sp. E19]|uniref:alginate O-acetyltransferase AlgX-related protein n=1 Tax=Halomonas sp. E19 TaxID=3397247 RepID=UPI004033AD1D